MICTRGWKGKSVWTKFLAKSDERKILPPRLPPDTSPVRMTWVWGSRGLSRAGSSKTRKHHDPASPKWGAAGCRQVVLAHWHPGTLPPPTFPEFSGPIAMPNSVRMKVLLMRLVMSLKVFP